MLFDVVYVSFASRSRRSRVPLMAAEIIVTGRAEVQVSPDVARVRIDIYGEGETREIAYADAAALSAAVDELLEARRDFLGSVTGTAVVVQPKTRWRKGESVRTGWRAARATTVEVQAFDELGGLLAEFAQVGASVAGPRWDVDADNAAYSQARAAAAADARARAAAYADGLGLTVGSVVWVSEPGLRRGGDGWSGELVAQSTRAGGHLDELQEPIIAVAPAELTVSAAVEVAFEFEVRAT
jgi:uncharacterized protein YggE